MKKLLAGVLSLVIVFSFASNVHAGVDDFTISDYQIDLYLGRDTSGRSTLRTKELITAQFPNYDQNHGIERAIPTTYDKHATSLKINTVEDLYNPNSSTHTPYSTYESNGNEVVRIGDPDKYVYREHKYLLDYTQRDVTKYFNDSGFEGDEFYWDTNGVDWRVPIDELTVRVHIDQALRSAQKNEGKCYLGFAGEGQACELTKEGDAYVVTASALHAHQNVTVAFGFAPHTFADYQPSLWERVVQIWGLVTAASSAVALGLLAWIGSRWSAKRNRKKDVGTIVPEYIPPKDASVSAAADVIDSPRGVMTAQILDLAVRHYLKIYQTQEKSMFKKPEYDIEIVRSIEGLKWEEQELLRDLFSGSVDVGSKLSLKTLQKSTGFYTRLQNNAGDLKKRLRGEYGLRAQYDQEKQWFKRTGWVLLALSVVLLSPVMFVVAITSFILGATLWQLSDKGVELRRYLLGLKDYIKVAETERIAMLQSPEGAAKVGASVDAANPAELIKLYERVLPYAVLFGLEKQWGQQLGQYYEAAKSQPDWYNSARGFNAYNFASAMNTFSSSGVSYARPSSSSSSGSGGGGFSGGGGGGGGGGGW